MKRKRVFNLSGRWSLTVLAAMLMSFPLYAQLADSFRYAAPLDTITKTGFYKIVVTPAIAAKCKVGLFDLRIRDAKGAFVPYVLQSDLPVTAAEGFSEFPTLPDIKEIDTYNNGQVANISSSPVHSLLLYIRNIGVRRLFTLSGSDDRDKWFIIQEHIPLEPSNETSVGYNIQQIEFPASSYKYFKINQEGKGLPVKIIRVGVATQQLSTGKYLSVPDPVIAQKDSSGHSYITLKYNDAYLIDRLELSISGPTLYKRKARIYYYDRENPNEDIMIDPTQHSFVLPSIKTDEIMIEINNADNALLRVDKAVTSQLERHLLSYLQPGRYELLAGGNAWTGAPEYDLKYFIDSVTQAAEILPGALQAIKKPAPPPPPAKDRSGLFLWIVIVIVLGLLIFLSINMLKAIPRGPQKEDTK